MEYELMFLIGDNKRANLDKITEDVKNIVTKAGGTWVGNSVVFDRKLAYEINHIWKGTYFVQRFTLPTKDERTENLGPDELPKDVIGEITRQMNIYKDVLRYIIVNAQDLPPLEDFAKQIKKDQKTTLKEKGGKIDEKLEEALNI